ncbi:MAG: peptidyl-prolyl cis-trans isomerase [Chthoniobacter sp.]|jgi:peptidyl-prolyl cis-trans isomerase D|nr:peptidyl-prolyl cis-trans isomerase [Chthoniobacter sp.]
MVNLIRRFQQPLMIFITVIIIIAFTWLYSDTRFMDRMGADRMGRIYGRPISQAQFIRTGRNYELSRGLQMNEIIKALCALPDEVPEFMISMYQLPEEYAQQFVWNTMVLRHEAERLGIDATQRERDELIKKMPAFQTNGAFDPTKLSLFITGQLTPRGLSEDALENLASDQLKLKKIKQVLGSTFAPSASEVRAAYEARHQKLEASVIRWDFAEFLKAQQPTEEEAKKAYEERKATLQTEEQRKVKFVAFTLPPADKPLAGKERVDALGALSEKAQDFSVAMTDKNAKLDEAAAKFGVKIEESPAFTSAAPPKELGNAPEVAEAAFKLSKEDPNSDPVQTARGYYILQLAEVIPARPRTFDEAKTALIEQLKTERAQEAMNLKATEVRNKIEAELKAGKSFAEAAVAAGVKAEPFPPFSLSESPPKEPNADEVMRAASQLNEGQLSAFVPTQGAGGASGGLLVHLAKKQPIDEAAFEKDKALVAEQVARGKRDAVFRQWFKLRRAEANVQLAQRHG